MTVEKLPSIQVANMDINYWLVRLSSRGGGDIAKEVDRGIIILASYEYYFIRVLVILV